MIAVASSIAVGVGAAIGVGAAAFKLDQSLEASRPDGRAALYLPSDTGRTFFAGAARPVAVLPSGERRLIDSVLNVRGTMHYGEFVWNDDKVPAGRRWVRIDLDAQIMSVFRGNHEVGTAVVLYGADHKPTPLGSFPILAKFRDHVSSIYDAPMPYTLRLTGDGVAIHGSNVRAGAATHGCIGIPTAFAARVFKEMRLGDLVVIVRGSQIGALRPQESWTD
ncbi:L,D-transpeptidase family protein [Sphingomonas guangdongensis]|uniref:L,D-transpeptidase family protein n=1 Tax=Sphingomonas guangdongensis TaxID=1141890 RepID=UPI001FE4A2D1|nr:L,D-transpeptidase family protein [Sphingomonas guangdongensis]